MAVLLKAFIANIFYDMGFVLFYLGGLIFAILPSYLQHKNDANWASLGASGAVSAVLFAYILFPAMEADFCILHSYTRYYFRYFICGVQYLGW